MSTLRLLRTELANGRLPPLCVVCGAPTEVQATVTPRGRREAHSFPVCTAHAQSSESLGLRVRRASTSSITLTGVADGFRQAVIRQRLAGPVDEAPLGDITASLPPETERLGRAPHRSTVTLQRGEWEQGVLPLVCVWCGQTAERYVAHSFHRGQEKRTVWMPVCVHDKDYEGRYARWTAFLFVSIPAAVALAVSFALYATGVIPWERTRPGAKPGDEIAPFALVGSFFFIAGMLPVIRWRNARAIRDTTKWGKDKLEVEGVAEEFALALEVQRQRGVLQV